jgi:hypothetical protein
VTVEYLRFIRWSALGAACLSSAAVAQSERKLEVTVTTRTLYDSNFARSTRAQAAVRGIEPEEVRFSPALNVEAGLPFGRHLLRLNAVAGYDFHAANTRFNRERLEGRFRLGSQFGRCNTEVEASLARRQTELEDIIQGPLDNAETVKLAQLGARCPREVGLVPSALVRVRSIDNSQVARRNVDSDSWLAEAGLSYVRPSLGEVGLFASHSETDYPNRTVRTGPATFGMDGFETNSLGVRVARNIGLLLRGSVSAAYTQVSREGSQDDFSSLTYSTNLLIRPQARLSGTLLAEKRVEPSTRIGVTYSVDEIYRAEALYALSPRVALTAGASRREREFEAAEDNGPAIVTRERTVASFASVRVAVRPKFTVVLDALRERRKTSDPLFNYTATRIGLSTRLAF